MDNGLIGRAGRKRAAMVNEPENLDADVVRDFGWEWRRFNQRALPPAEIERIFAAYFSIFPWENLPVGAIGFDAGCGSGRWAARVAPRVGSLHCVDASAEAIEVARRSLDGVPNVSFHHVPLEAMPMPDASMDFGYSLGVLHHLPDPAAGLADCVRKLRPGAPMLIYIYYAFDDRPAWYRALWRMSNGARRYLARAPFRVKSAVSELVAALVYWPLARGAWLFERLGGRLANWPLSAYRELSFYTMRTDALDRL
ncbi:MAG: SAM-dependent methyltransferase, partial [Proteobacteria bacterium]